MLGQNEKLDAVEHVLVPRRTVLGVLGVLVEDGVVVALGSNTPELTKLKKIRSQKTETKRTKNIPCEASK